MTSTNALKGGDFASYLEATQNEPPIVSAKAGTASPTPFDAPITPPRQTIQQVVVEGDEPTDEFLEEWRAQTNLPELSDEEFARQALEAPGDDGDPRTPE